MKLLSVFLLHLRNVSLYRALFVDSFMTSSLELCHFHFTSLFDYDDEISLHQRVAHLTNSQPFFSTHISTDAESDPNRAPPCDPAVCVLPDCFCSEDGTQIPGDLPAKDVPQMITITFDDAINNNNIELYREMFNGKRKNPNGCDIKATVSFAIFKAPSLVLLVLVIKKFLLHTRNLIQLNLSLFHLPLCSTSSRTNTPIIQPYKRLIVADTRSPFIQLRKSRADLFFVNAVQK